MLGKLLGVMPGLETRELFDTIQQTARLAAETHAEVNVEELAAGSVAAHFGLDPPGRPAAVQPLDL
jgi:hypothetical protein